MYISFLSVSEQQIGKHFNIDPPYFLSFNEIIYIYTYIYMYIYQLRNIPMFYNMLMCQAKSMNQ